MKNKLIITAAFMALGSVSGLAQVYSVNAVGYVNVNADKGFTMIANPLDNKDGNTVEKLFAGVPAGTIIYKYDGTKYLINAYDPDLGGWDDPAMTLVPGGGAWILNPADAAVKITFVGEVMQGNLVNTVPQGFAIKSSMVPQSGALDTVLGFPIAEGDLFYFFRGGKYEIYSYDPAFGGWDPSAPSPAVGEAFWTFMAAQKDWTRNFSVNQ